MIKQTTLNRMNQSNKKKIGCQQKHRTDRKKEHERTTNAEEYRTAVQIIKEEQRRRTEHRTANILNRASQAKQKQNGQNLTHKRKRRAMKPNAILSMPGRNAGDDTQQRHGTQE